ncbi:MAG TPA: glycosyltransferase family 39 protein [bacterium]|nr:glycosyltransferase family 39 protein [bacterium]HPR87881.1 glycosyltransferase family 39 protein [bacterium]
MQQGTAMIRGGFPYRHRGRWILLAILTVACMARLLLITRLDNRLIYSDEIKNVALAARLAAGAGYTLDDGRPTAIIPAGYPLWLAALRLIGLSEPVEVRFVQIGVSLLTLFVLYLFAHSLFGARAALLAAAGGALYPYFILLPGTILATTLFSLQLVLASWLYIKAINTNNNKLLFFDGVIWGWAILTVTTAGVLVGATLVWHAGHARYSWRLFFRQAGLYLAGIALLVLPWMARNQMAMGRPVLASNGGYNLWLGNNPDSDLEEPCSQPTPPEMDERIIRSGSELYADSLFSATARTWIKAHPALFLRRTLLKALYFWRLDPSPVTASYLRAGPWTRIAGLLAFAPLLALAFLGCRKAPAALKKSLGLFLYYAAAFTAVHALMIVKVRFRLPLDHLLIMTAAYGLTTVWSSRRKHL